MQKNIEVGDYMLMLYAVPKAAGAIEDEGGEITGGHGAFKTVAEAIAHSEAWGGHYHYAWRACWSMQFNVPGAMASK